MSRTPLVQRRDGRAEVFVGKQPHELFLGAGGRSSRFVPALGGSADHVGALARLALRNLAEWARSLTD